jgi:hypothetical protein
MKESTARAILAIQTNAPLNDREARKRKFTGNNILRFCLLSYVVNAALAVYLTRLSFLLPHYAKPWSFLAIFFWCLIPVLLLYIWIKWWKVGTWIRVNWGERGKAYVNSGRAYFGEELIGEEKSKDKAAKDSFKPAQDVLAEMRIERKTNNK